MATSPEGQLATMIAWFKGEHGLTHGYANLVAHTTLKSDAGSKAAAGDDLLAKMFAGDKAALRPIYDALIKEILAFGADIDQAPKKGYMSLRRKTQFATLHPSTKTRFDVGIKRKGVEPAGRLEKAGSWNAMVTRRRAAPASRPTGDWPRAMGALVALPVALGTDPRAGKVDVREILIPGTLVGWIVGYLTRRHERREHGTQGGAWASRAAGASPIRGSIRRSIRGSSRRSSRRSSR